MNQNVFSSEPRSRPILPHDLLWISCAEDLLNQADLPEWVHRAMAQVPVVVVRRSGWIGDTIPVGIRGQLRSERFATSVPLHCVRQRVTPEDLLNQRRWCGNPRTGTVAAMRALETIAHLWSSPEYHWGPTGSVGFELATGVQSATAESDLDVIIYAPVRLPKEDARLLLTTLDHQPVAIDVQLDTPFGSVALREYVAPSSTRILIKTSNGPRLVLDPWNPQQGELQ
jgi:phosphoribosyl-dephospho-CoA transferase